MVAARALAASAYFTSRQARKYWDGPVRRVIAATNRDLDQMVSRGTFRADLFYRLGVFPIHMPPLRDRQNDIALLVWYFVERLRTRLGKTIESIPDEVMHRLRAYDWPGNIRELENTIERAMILSPGRTLELADALPPQRRPAPEQRPARDEPRAVTVSGTLDGVQREHIIRVLEACDWRVRGEGGAAERLGLNRSTLQSRMRKLGIQRPAP